jgi:GTPase SAR1 family protein
MDNILREFLALDIPDSICYDMRDDTKRFLYSWLKEKFTLINKQSAPMCDCGALVELLAQQYLTEYMNGDREKCAILHFAKWIKEQGVK